MFFALKIEYQSSWPLVFNIKLRVVSWMALLMRRLLNNWMLDLMLSWMRILIYYISLVKSWNQRIHQYKNHLFLCNNLSFLAHQDNKYFVLTKEAFIRDNLSGPETLIYLVYLFCINLRLFSVSIKWICRNIYIYFLSNSFKFKIIYEFQDIPFLSILIFIFLSVIQLLTYTQPVMVACGIIIGWVYLRFYQSHGKGIRGDMRENFEVATLFPPFSR